MDKKLLSIFLMLFCFGFSNAATITSTGIGDWSSISSWVGNVVPTVNDDVIIAAGSTITISSNVSAKSLTINGILIVANDQTMTTSAGNILRVVINGMLSFGTASNKNSISFPAQTVIDVNSPGKIDTSGTCNNNVAIYIDTVKFAVCAGGGNAVFTFTDLNNAGGTLQSNPTSNIPVCEGTILTFTADKVGAVGDANELNWWWDIKPSGSSSFTKYPDKQSVVSFASALSGSYEAKLTYTTKYNGTFYSNFKTIFAAVNPKPATPTISANGSTTFCDGGSVTLTSSIGSSYLWSTGATSQSIVVTTSGNYSVQITNASNCQSAASIPATVNKKSILALPNIFNIIQPTCVIPTGSITLNGLPMTTSVIPNWTIQQSGTVIRSYVGGGDADPTTYTISSLAPGFYNFTIEYGDYCPVTVNNVEVKNAEANIWRGSSLGWSKGSAPSSSGTESIEFAEDYQSVGDLNGCSCKVDAGKQVTIKGGHTLFIENEVVVASASGAKLIFENNASLVQVNNVINTGEIVYMRNTTPVRRYDFTFWSSPVTRTPAFTLNNLSPNTLGDKYYKFSPVNGWVIIYSGAAEMEKGIGYIIRTPQYFDITTAAVYNASFVGVPNNGTITIPLVAAERSNLLGNPYPSAIYADQFIVDNSDNLYGTLYFWTHNSPPSNLVAGDATYNYTTSDYAVYNLTGSVDVGNISGSGATTDGNRSSPSGYIAAGQAFFVKSKTTVSAVFTNSMRVRGNNTQFFKTASSNKTNIEAHKIWLNLSNTQGAFKQILIGYIEGATNSWDNNYDGLTRSGNAFLDFYSINENMKLVVQGRALPFVETDVVPLGYKSTIAGEFTISIDHAVGDLNTDAIYLEDKTSSIIHDLRTSNYTFTTAIGTFDNRFVLRYANKTLATNDFQDADQSVLVSVKDKVIKMVSTKEIISNVSIFDVSGRILYSKTGVGSTELQISNLQSENQLLLVKVSLENEGTFTTKIIF